MDREEYKKQKDRLNDADLLEHDIKYYKERLEEIEEYEEAIKRHKDKKLQYIDALTYDNTRIQLSIKDNKGTELMGKVIDYQKTLLINTLAMKKKDLKEL